MIHHCGFDLHSFMTKDGGHGRFNLEETFLEVLVLGEPKIIRLKIL